MAIGLFDSEIKSAISPSDFEFSPYSEVLEAFVSYEESMTVFGARGGSKNCSVHDLPFPSRKRMPAVEVITIEKVPPLGLRNGSSRDEKEKAQ